MDIIVRDVALSGHGIEMPEQSVYETHPCPICESSASLKVIGQVVANNTTSLESAFCENCQHRFHRKFPNSKWLENYYQKKFDNKNSAQLMQKVASKPLMVSLYRKLRHKLGKLIRYGSSQQIPNRIHDFLSGLTKEDAAYYEKNLEINKILEVGCGNGDNLLYFEELGYEAYGTEVSSVRLATCKEKGLKVFPIGLDGFGSVKSLGPFDFIFSTHVLEHVVDVNSHVRQLAEMLRPDGYMYIETPDLSGESFVYQTHTIFHVQTFTLASMLKLLAKYGLVAVRVAVDNNIQVLVQKRNAPAAALVSGRIFSDGSIPYLEAMASAAPNRYKFSWDHYRAKIERLSDSSVIYNSDLRPLRVKPGPNTHQLVLEIEKSASKEDLFPVRFIYQHLNHPPFWYKI